MDRFRTITGAFEVEYAEQGAETPLVLLHGWGGTKRLWRYIWPQAVTRWRAIAPDLPGWGGSDKPRDAPYTPEWYARWLRTFLDARGVGKADIVAHSMAAQAATSFAVESPSRVRKLVLVTPPVDGRAAFMPRVARLASPFLRRLLWWFGGLGFVRRAIAKDFTALAPWDDEDLAGIFKATYKSMSRSLDAMFETDLRPKLAEVRVPTLVVGASRDTLVLTGQSEVAAKVVPGARYVVMDESGHCPMIEKPAEFNRDVLEFLAEGLPRLRPPQW